MKIRVAENHHLTATDRRYLPIAYKYCQENGVSDCTVNCKQFHFDNDAKQGWVMTIKGGWKDYCKSRFSWD